MEVSLLAAFLGGALALLSPCGALLLPAFFASTARTGGRLVLHGAVFFGGLAITLVPLGLGASLVGVALTTHRDVLVTVAGWMIVVFGSMQLFGVGFDLGRVVPGLRSVQAGASRRAGLPRSFLLGTVSGVAGFCAGPILGAVLTMAATEDNAVVGGTLLAMYAAGMVVPLLVLAAVWGRLGQRDRSRLRGRTVRLGPLTLHTTSLVTGVLLIVVGVVFLSTNGMAALPELVPALVLAEAQAGLLTVAAAIPEPLLIVTGALAALALWYRRHTRTAGADGPETAHATTGVHAPAPDGQTPGDGTD